MKRTLSIFALSSLTSCASFLNEHKPIHLTSEPTGAHWTASDGQSGTTPHEFWARDFGRRVHFEFTLDGYEPQTVVAKPQISGYVVGNVLLGGIIGILFDAFSDKAYNFRPSAIAVTLEPTVEIGPVPAAEVKQ